MKIGIHHRNKSYSEQWISYLDRNNINYESINLYSTDIISDLNKKKITHILFHFGAYEYRSNLYLKFLSYVLSQNNFKIFPNPNEYLHYDDKLKQKYLFEMLDINHAKMHVFYSRDEAMRWTGDKSNYPFVFKLRNGFESNNVQLVKTIKEGQRLVKKMFGKGISPVPSTLEETINVLKKKNLTVAQRIKRCLKKLQIDKQSPKYFLPIEKGYFLVQEFIPDLNYDYRIKVVGDICWGFKRYTRKNDFRASGSGISDFDQSTIPRELIHLAFVYADKLKMRSVAFDFVYDHSKAVVLEISYCYGINEEQLNGYWNRDLSFQKGYFRPEDIIIEQHLKVENL